MEVVVYRVHKEYIDKKLYEVIKKLVDKETYDTVLIKPNICGFYPPDHHVLMSLLNFFSKVSNRVIIGETESTIHKPLTRYKRLGIDKIASKFDNVELLDLTHYDVVKIKIPNPHTLREIPISRLVLKCDYLINLARIGSHPTTKITSALKNLFGLIASSHKYFKYHPRGMDKVIADIAKVIKPNINFVEVSDYLLISQDALAIDVIASRLYGINPLEVKHLNLVSEDRGKPLSEFIKHIELIDV